MLKVLKRWLGPQRSEWSKVAAKGSSKVTTKAWQDVADWADLKRHTFKRTREGDGFVIDAGLTANPWRLEWGPSQRAYIKGDELRFRMELQLPSALQMLVLNRPLLESLEHESFERYTEVNQTQVDVSTSEEMRWVAMFSQSDLSGQRALRPHLAALSSPPAHVEAWLKGDLAAALLLVSASVLPKETPWVLMTLRGRVYLRMALPVPKPETLDAMGKLFACACAQAVRVSVSNMDATATSPAVLISAPLPMPIPTAWENAAQPKK